MSRLEASEIVLGGKYTGPGPARTITKIDGDPGAFGSQISYKTEIGEGFCFATTFRRWAKKRIQEGRS